MLKRIFTGLAHLIVAVSAALTGCAVPPTQQTQQPHQPTVSSPTNSAAAIGNPSNSKETAEIPDQGKPLDDMWVQLAQDFTWTDGANPLVKSAVDAIIKNGEDFARRAERAAPYLWYIDNQLTRRKLPAELALVPLIESGYRPRARSPQGAVGLWQFMPETGRRFGLKHSRWYDGRSDVIASTQAALDYLERLNDHFNGDWLLALAAYNCGPAKVRRAIKQSNSDNYWDVAENLPAETTKHIARLLAAIQIIRDPGSHGITLQPIPNVAIFSEVDLGGPIARRYLTTIEGWSAENFDVLNPAFTQAYTDPQGPFRILVPIAIERQIRDTIGRIPTEQRLPVRIHSVQHGDTLSEIAHQYNVSIGELKRHNPLHGTRINIGTELVVPSPLQALDEQECQRPDLARVDYTVREGDSLWTIGQKFCSSYKTIAKLNNLSLNTPLQPGQCIQVRDTRQVQRYAVRRGDSLWIIARKFNVTIKQLRKWNDLSRHRLLQPGESLFVSNPLSLARQEI